MSNKHDREPIAYTCPTIDKYIKSIKLEIFKDRELKSMNESELFDAACSMRNELEMCIDYLEELRKSNDTLRQWGITEAEEVDSLQSYVEELEHDATQSPV